MSDSSAPAASSVDTVPSGISPADIEARQDDVLRQLDELEKRIARVLSDYAASVKTPAKPAAIPDGTAIATPPIATPPIAAVASGATLPFAPTAGVATAAAKPVRKAG